MSLLSWLATSYLISNAAFQPLSGRLTDIYSRRSGLLFSNVTFALGNLICGVANSETTIITGRVIAGIGGGGLTAISTLVSSDIIPLRDRGVVQGLANICYGFGSGLGGIFGGFANDRFGWRWAFLIQVPLLVVSTVQVVFKVNLPVKTTDTSKIKRVDFLGAITLVITLVLLLLGLNTGGNQVSWTSPVVLVSLPLSAVFLGVFLYVEAKLATEPIIPVHLLLDRTVLAACLTNWFSTMNVFGLLFYVVLYFQVQGYSTTAAGLRLVPMSVGTAMGSMASGILMRATGRYLILIYASMLLQALSAGLMCTMNLATAAFLPFIYFFLLGVSYGSMLTVTLVGLVAAVSHEFHAVATSASYAFRSTGSTIGITVASTVFQNILRSELWTRFGDRKDATELISKIRDNLDEIYKLPDDWRAGVLSTYMDSLRGAYLALFGLAVLGLLTSLGMREHKLHANLARK